MQVFSILLFDIQEFFTLLYWIILQLPLHKHTLFHMLFTQPLSLFDHFLHIHTFLFHHLLTSLDPLLL